MQLDLTDLESVEAYIKGMAPAQRQQLEDKIHQNGGTRVWYPQTGPQSEAFYHEADELLYGGAVGGGKTDLLVGLATTAHRRSVIYRLQSTDLDSFWDRLAEAARPIIGTNNAIKKIMKTSDGRVIEGAHLERPGSEKSQQGRARDLIGFDEAAQLDELKVEFVMKWLRSTHPGQRQRVVFATNPPMPEIKDGQLVDVGVGDWLLRWFAPWLDELYPNPAASGEIRWCFMVREGDRLTTIWVDGPGCYDPDTHKLVEFPSAAARQQAIDTGSVIVAKSRTFVRSLLKDNIFLKGTGYAEKMSSTPEPLKSMLLKGDFTVKGDDHPMQVIPQQWLLMAQERWKEWQDDPDRRKLLMLVLFGDVAQGGVDTSVLAPLYTGDYFGDLVVKPGRDTPDGPSVANMILGARRNNALIGLDGTGGWAGDTYRTLHDHHQIEAELVVSSHASGEWTADNRYKFGNVRTHMWWGFREALDPEGPYAIALPPSTRMRAQLIAPHWYARGKHMFIESKDELRARLGSSTDEADAVIGAWYLREEAIVRGNIVKPRVDIVDKLNERYPGGANDPDSADNYDPLADW